MTNPFNYDAIAAFNEMYYKDLLFEKNICGAEIFIGTAKEVKNGTAIETDIDLYFYPASKNRRSYLVPSDFVRLLPFVPTDTTKISYQTKAYTVVKDCDPKGFGEEMVYTFRELVDTLCDYKSTNPKDFLLWKIIALVAYIARVNVRVSSGPAFGKDSVMKVLNSLMGNVGIVHNPTIAKLEFLLTNKIIMTNEVAGVKAENRDELQHYYLTCGDFSNTYEKRSVANIRGARDTYNISKLSNVVCFNDIDCYPTKQQDKYFDKVFQRAVRERFLEFRFKGKLTEDFGTIINPQKYVEENVDIYKNTIKTIKFFQLYPHVLPKEFKKKDYGFSDRAKRNWDTIVSYGISAYANSQEEFDDLCEHLYGCYEHYRGMFGDGKQASLTQAI